MLYLLASDLTLLFVSLRSAHSGKELWNLYRNFRAAYFSMVDAHHVTIGELADRGLELKSVQSELGKLNTVKADLDKAKKDLDTAN